MKNYFEKEGLTITEKQQAQLVAFRELLLEYNQKFNLTSITDEEEITIKHFVDSVMGYKHLPKIGKVIDVGSGAGFPAIPLIITGDGTLEFTLLDSLNKRVNFLNEVISRLALPNATAIHSRIEDQAKNYRESYDCVIARAVAPLNVLCEYALPLLKVGGTLVAYKGDAEEEIINAKKALSILGGKVKMVDEYILNGEYKRSFVIVEKVKPTPIKYPRGQNKPRNSPL
ncbi:MAG: 16S rRNA (guanine(527)-N(7))-methyltransferase RsmG [Clostridia bacterium]|nr:16S rRNA (guanine(527)-N(7))-methyltransferase RsmG [Clostridia bacterium]